jgi:hypothetical protein
MRLEATLTPPSPRFVIIHYHILKNGGSTIESILEREFPHGFATLHGASSSATLDGRHLEAFLRQHPHIVAVSSHHLRYPKPVIRHMVSFDCCFLRHPLDRLDSLYRYLRRIEPADPLSCRAHRMSARDFFRDLVDESPHILSDIQVTQLACSGAFTRPPHQGDLDRAADAFRDMAIPGLIEMFDESLIAAEYFLRPAFPTLSLEYIPKNVSRPIGPMAPMRPLNRQERLVRLWGGNLYDDLARLNQLDLELFRRAENEIRRRIALVPKFDRRLAEFRTRCSRFAETEALTLGAELSESGAGTQVAIMAESEERTSDLSVARQA